MKITLDIKNEEEGVLHEYGFFSKFDNENKSLDIKVDCGQVYINGIEVISEEQINKIGYFLNYSVDMSKYSKSKSKALDNEDIYPESLIVCLGDDRKLKGIEKNNWSLEFGKYSKYTFNEIFKMILTNGGTDSVDFKYVKNFKKHLIKIYDKAVEEIS